jgi:hypothetical protein
MIYVKQIRALLICFPILDRMFRADPSFSLLSLLHTRPFSNAIHAG